MCDFFSEAADLMHTLQGFNIHQIHHPRLFAPKKPIVQPLASVDLLLQSFRKAEFGLRGGHAGAEYSSEDVSRVCSKMTVTD
jgi:hypothetical protein